MLFANLPSDFVKEVDVVGCYVLHDGKFLVLHWQENKSNGGLWGLPAGKCDGDETISAAMVRELREETGIEVSEEKIVFFRSVAVRHAGRDFGYHMFSLRLNERSDIRLSPNEHQGYQWVTPEEAPALPLVHDQDECIQMFFSK